MFSLVAAIVASIVAALIVRASAKSVAVATPADLEKRLADAKTEADRRMQAAKAEATVKRDEVKQGFNQTLDQMEKDLADITETLNRKEASVKTREDALSERRRLVQERETQIKARQALVVPIGKHRADLTKQLRDVLVQRAGEDEGRLLADLVEARVSEANLHGTELKLRAEENAKAEAERRAKRIIGISNERFNMSHQPDLEHPGFRLNEPDIAGKIAADATFRDAFIAATDAELNVSDDGRSVDVRNVDPLKREISRRTLVYMHKQGVIVADRIPTVLSRVQKEVDKELDKAAERATRILRIAPLEGEVKRLFSRLLYRASYSQNQWHHAVEVAYVCGLMAAEMGLDVKTARRAGLLHDIGKAMTHDHEGSHALMGADVARHCGESEEVANAIGAHHGEEPMVSAYAEITAAGDAISGARPGARREITEAFNSKVDDLERIALSVKGVQRVHVMQGGREVRVFVGETESTISSKPQVGWDAIYGNSGNAGQRRGTDVVDAQMPDIARSIAEQIEEQLTYPGQIRVTVIREMRAVGVAR